MNLPPGHKFEKQKQMVTQSSGMPSVRSELISSQHNAGNGELGGIDGMSLEYTQTFYSMK